MVSRDWELPMNQLVATHATDETGHTWFSLSTATLLIPQPTKFFCITNSSAQQCWRRKICDPAWIVVYPLVEALGSMQHRGQVHLNLQNEQMGHIFLRVSFLWMPPSPRVGICSNSLLDDTCFVSSEGTTRWGGDLAERNWKEFRVGYNVVRLGMPSAVIFPHLDLSCVAPSLSFRNITTPPWTPTAPKLNDLGSFSFRS